MSEIVSRLLEGDTCVAVTSLANPDGSHRTIRTALSSFVLRGTHFWGMSPTLMMTPPDQAQLRPTVYAHTDCFADLEAVNYAIGEAAEGQEQEFRLARIFGQERQTRFVTSSDYEPIWNSSKGDDPAVLNDAIAEARDFRVALGLGGDLWLVQACALPQFMRNERYFRLSTPEGRVPFFMTWDVQALYDALPYAGAATSIRATTFQAGVVILSDGRFMWFNAPATGVYRDYQELRVFARRRPSGTGEI